MSASPQLPPPGGFLIRSVNWLGDAIMTTPALLQLKTRFPQTSITIATPEKLTDLWLHHPAVDHVIPFSPNQGAFALARRFRERPFTHALIFPNSFRSALEVFLARIPNRLGYRVQLRSLLLTRPVSTRPGHVAMRKRSPKQVRALVSNPPPTAQEHSAPSPPGLHLSPQSHHIHDYLYLVQALGADPTPVPPRIEILPDEITSALDHFKIIVPQPASPLFAMNPGAEYGPAKRWPLDRFVQAAIQLHQLTHCQWLLFGGHGDRPLTSSISQQVSAALPNAAIHNLAAQTSLRQLGALLKASNLLISNDSGPMHLAAAVGTPVVVPFGSTSPELTAPGLPNDPRHHLLRSSAPCNPCFLRCCPIDFRCMQEIAVDRVVAAALSIFP